MNKLRVVMPRIERVIRLFAYGLAFAFIFSVARKSQSVTATHPPASQVFAESSVASRSTRMLEIFASLPMKSPAQVLGQNIKLYDAALRSGDFSAAYNLRLPAWKSIVSEARAQEQFLAKVTRVHQVYTLAIEPLAKLPGGTTPAYIVSRLAIVDTPSEPNQWLSYVETWVTVRDSVALVGGSPWDQPSLPVLEVNLN